MRYPVMNDRLEALIDELLSVGDQQATSLASLLMTAQGVAPRRLDRPAVAPGQEGARGERRSWRLALRRGAGGFATSSAAQGSRDTDTGGVARPRRSLGRTLIVPRYPFPPDPVGRKIDT